MSPRAYDVVIVGAGIVGAACAAECASAGLKVAVIEAACVGGGATAAGMGHIVVMDDSDAQFALTRYSQVLWDQLAEELPPDCEFQRSGTIWIAADEEELSYLRCKERFYRERGVPVELLDERALAEAEPNLRRGLRGGLLVPGDSVLYPPCAARFLLERAQDRGATIFLGHPAVRFDEDGVRLRDGSFIAAGVIVNATGTWASELTPGLAIKKRKGHLAITERYPGFANHQLVEVGYIKSTHAHEVEAVAFNLQPRPTGQLLIGSSRQYDVEDPYVEHGVLARMLTRACEYIPRLAELSVIRTWIGFRAATPDNLPLIGPLPGRERVYLATGHEGLGITTSLGTAKLLVAQLLNRPSAIAIEPYLPSRMEHPACLKSSL
ncbi:MAG: FAD-binding oxidoreductase [Blastocatellia bacterium]|nr:FAD-binding oxidoreductase [Blastocatellia bacterium]MCS7157223.1 FAD-binding oxidoreductase [Blastocatellia bacterium]MCX7752314.1 FAD-binding oxidoreductase [Blastocatellia bacterium]MDW8167197.1 FAD-dependent oxidoreductase [Acidobacteriota bacterium]